MKKIVLASVVVSLAACSSTGPVAIRDVSPPPVVNDQQSATASSPQIAVTTPVAPSQSQTTLPLIEKLLQRADDAYQSKNYNQAIEVAERGLRIDRKEPRFYRVLAESYRVLGNRQQSVNFAKQGLQYAEKKSEVYQRLVVLSR